MTERISPFLVTGANFPPFFVSRPSSTTFRISASAICPCKPFRFPHTEKYPPMEAHGVHRHVCVNPCMARVDGLNGRICQVGLTSLTRMKVEIWTGASQYVSLCYGTGRGEAPVREVGQTLATGLSFCKHSQASVREVSLDILFVSWRKQYRVNDSVIIRSSVGLQCHSKKHIIGRGFPGYTCGVRGH